MDIDERVAWLIEQARPIADALPWPHDPHVNGSLTRHADVALAYVARANAKWSSWTGGTLDDEHFPLRHWGEQIADVMGHIHQMTTGRRVSERGQITKVSKHGITMIVQGRRNGLTEFQIGDETMITSFTMPGLHKETDKDPAASNVKRLQALVEDIVRRMMGDEHVRFVDIRQETERTHGAVHPVPGPRGEIHLRNRKVEGLDHLPASELKTHAACIAKTIAAYKNAMAAVEMDMDRLEAILDKNALQSNGGLEVSGIGFIGIDIRSRGIYQIDLTFVGHDLEHADEVLKVNMAEMDALAAFGRKMAAKARIAAKRMAVKADHPHGAMDSMTLRFIGVDGPSIHRRKLKQHGKASVHGSEEPATITWVDGVLRTKMALGEGILLNRTTITIKGTIPETLALALQGRPAGVLIDNRYVDPETPIVRAWTSPGQYQVELAPRLHSITKDDP